VFVTRQMLVWCGMAYCPVLPILAFIFQVIFWDQFEGVLSQTNFTALR
jgi:hypothetical protein